MLSALIVSFPWKSIWKIIAPFRVAFFTWTAAWERILTGENLRNRGLVLVDRCCLCKVNGEMVSHLLSHCSFSTEIWGLFLSICGIQ